MEERREGGRGKEGGKLGHRRKDGGRQKEGVEMICYWEVITPEKREEKDAASERKIKLMEVNDKDYFFSFLDKREKKID